MVELTHGGTWIKWSGLSARDRNWAILSFVASGLSALPLGLAAGDWGYRVGYQLGSGQAAPADNHYADMLATDWFPYLMLASAIFAIVSGFAWWQFSRNQDEMFNRIQNYALGVGAAWTFAIAVVWWILSIGGWVGELPLTAFVVLGWLLIMVLWFRAVRRWA
jgi:hypothetical protein